MIRWKWISRCMGGCVVRKMRKIGGTVLSVYAVGFGNHHSGQTDRKIDEWRLLNRKTLSILRKNSITGLCNHISMATGVENLVIGCLTLPCPLLHSLGLRNPFTAEIFAWKVDWVLLNPAKSSHPSMRLSNPLAVGWWSRLLKPAVPLVMRRVVQPYDCGVNKRIGWKMVAEPSRAPYCAWKG